MGREDEKFQDLTALQLELAKKQCNVLFHIRLALLKEPKKIINPDSLHSLMVLNK